MTAGRLVALPAACALLALVACNREPSASTSSAVYLDPQESFRKRTCFRCHGREREGTEIGPPLLDLTDNWDVEKLMRYIQDPASFRAVDPRIQQLVEDYRGRLMKGYRLSEPELRSLATWLLKNPPPTGRPL